MKIGQRSQPGATPSSSRSGIVWTGVPKIVGHIHKQKNFIFAGLVFFAALRIYSLIEHPATLPQNANYDLVYDSTHPQYCMGDLYQPARAEGTALPAVIVVHGGGWEAGSKNDGSTGVLIGKLLDSGFVVFNINYRLKSEDGSFPNNLNDVNQAVTFLEQNAKKYDVDQKGIAILGFSAGAHLALLSAYSGRKSKNRLRAVVAIAPATDLTDLHSAMINKHFPPHDRARQKLASPVEHVDSAISTMLIHGTADSVVPYSQSKLLAASLMRLHKPVQVLLVKGATHNFIAMPGKDQDETNLQIVRFLKTQEH